MGSWGHFCDSWGERPGGGEHSAAVFCLWLSPFLQRILGVGAEGPSSSFSTPCVPNPLSVLSAPSLPGKTTPRGLESLTPNLPASRVYNTHPMPKKHLQISFFFSLY